MLRLHVGSDAGLRNAAFGATLALLCASAYAADDALWQLQSSDEANGTQVYLRSRGDQAPEFRAVTRLPVRLSALVAVLMDTDHMPDWVYRTRQVVRLETHGPMQGVSQVITAMPWPLRDREAIVAWQLVQDPQTGVVTIEGRSAPDKLPPSPELVRMPSFESRWRFAPQSGGDVEVRFEGHGDPGGSLASPLLRGFIGAAVWQAPLYTVNALRQMVQRPEFRDAVVTFIREPGQ